MKASTGADPIEGREGFAALLDRIEGNGLRTVIVEDASRFARELVVQELGIALLAKRDVRLLTASGDDLTDSDDLGRKMMRQVAGAFAEYEKGRLVAKLRSGRERVRRETGRKVGGRKSHAELWPKIVALAKRLRRSRPKTGDRRSFRQISVELAKAGYRNERGQPFNPQSIRAMVQGSALLRLAAGGPAAAGSRTRGAAPREAYGLTSLAALRPPRCATTPSWVWISSMRPWAVRSGGRTRLARLVARLRQDIEEQGLASTVHAQLEHGSSASKIAVLMAMGHDDQAEALLVEMAREVRLNPAHADWSARLDAALRDLLD